jgi:G2/mitotic-specific cyclin 3/4
LKVRTDTDENVVLDQVVGKTIHKRNQSSPALSTMAAMAKAGTKRSAFADVSNIVSSTRPSKDDSALPYKKTTQITSKPVTAKVAPLTKPAQRPMSVSGIKNLLIGNGNGNSGAQDDIPKTTSTEIIVQSQAAPPRKLTKRSTTIFRDVQPALDTVQEQTDAEPVAPAASLIAARKAVSGAQSAALIKTDLPPPAAIEVVAEPMKEPILFTSDASLPGIESVSLVADILPAPQAATTTVEPVKLSGFKLDMDASQLAVVDTNNNHNNNNDVPALESVVAYNNAYTEPEEYWEETQENLEEEGFVTARSFRSKGENTTGGVTTVLFPQITARSRRELTAATIYVEANRSIDDVEDEKYDTSMVAEYGEEIFQYMRTMEVKMLPNENYMDNQHEIQWSMRTVLMDWLIQVHHRFNLLPETLFLCVNYIDRFLSCKVVSLGKLQLVGATAIFIAAKYEEINCPSIQEIVYMVDHGYSVDEILKAERFMLTMLGFELGWPGPMSFLRRISKADDYDLETRTLAKYFLEVTIMDERFIGSPPSYVAAASHCLARLMLRKGSWVRSPLL